MDDIRNILDTLSHIEEDIQVDDGFSIEFGEELVVESTVTGFTDDGVIIDLDNTGIELLSEKGVIFEETDWSKYDEPTISRVKKGTAHRADRTDYDEPTALRRKADSTPSIDVPYENMTKAHALAKEMFGTNSPIQWVAKQKEDDSGYTFHFRDKAKLDAFEKELNQISEAEYQGRKVTLNKPMPNPEGKSKSKVYVKDGDKVKKVTFGDPDMRIRKNNPEARKSFRARHNCDNPGPKTKARYWSCRAW